MNIKRSISASSLLVSLVIITILLTFIFTRKDILVNQEKRTHNEYYRYLNDKFRLISEVAKTEQQNNLECERVKSDTVLTKIGNITYSFHCEFISLFVDKKPTKKYVYAEKIEDYINTHLVKDHLIRINSLSALPASSLNDPKIVIVTEDILGKLDNDFYGIIITSHRFELNYGAKVYGVLYSSYPNKANRYISYDSRIIEKLSEKYSHWRYLPYSRNILKNEKMD